MKNIFTNYISLQNEEDSSFACVEDSFEHANMVLAVSFGNDDPTTVQEGFSTSDGDKQREAMKDEYDSFSKNNCWTLTDSQEVTETYIMQVGY